MKQRLILAITLGAAALAVAAQTQAMSAPKLTGKVGPGFTISLKDATGKRVTSLKAGSYTFAVTDKSSLHNFTVENTKTEKETVVTNTPFVGAKSKTVALTKGKWKFYCSEHESSMFGFITVK